MLEEFTTGSYFTQHELFLAREQRLPHCSFALLVLGYGFVFEVPKSGEQVIGP